MTGLWLALWLVGATPSAADDVDPVDIAAKLLSARDHQGALTVLDEAAPPEEDLARARFHTMKGLAHLGLHQAHDAKRELRDAVRFSARGGADDRRLFLALARAAADDEDCAMALDALQSYGPDLYRRPDAVRLRARCFVEQKRPGAAYATLRRGAETILTADALSEQQVVFLLERKLRQAALDVALARAPHQEADAGLSLIGRFAEHGAHREAHALCLALMTVFPDDARFVRRRAYALIDMGHLSRAARVLEGLAHQDGALYRDAAELYRRQGRLSRALVLNRRVPDQDERLVQRFGLLVDAGADARARALLPRLSRRGLLDSDDMRYAAAYVHLRVGAIDDAREAARDIHNHEQRVAITEALDRCSTGEAACF